MTTKQDWTTQPETSADEREQLELEKIIFGGKNTRDAAMLLVVTTLVHLQKRGQEEEGQALEISFYFDLVRSLVTMVRHESELELLKFIREHQGDFSAEELPRFLELFEQRTKRCCFDAATDSKRLVSLLSEASHASK